MTTNSTNFFFVLCTSSVQLFFYPDCPGCAFCPYSTTHTTNIHAPGWIQTRNPRKRSAADPRLRPLGQDSNRASLDLWPTASLQHQSALLVTTQLPTAHAVCGSSWGKLSAFNTQTVNNRTQHHAKLQFRMP